MSQMLLSQIIKRLSVHKSQTNCYSASHRMRMLIILGRLNCEMRFLENGQFPMKIPLNGKY